MEWDKVVDLLKDCSHPGQIGWRVARLMRINPKRVWENALDVKIGLYTIAVLKQAVSLRKRPKGIVFDSKGNVTVQWV
jgi:hypothetical protein